MNPQTLLLIFRGVELLATLGPLALAEAMKIRDLLQAPGSDITAELKAIKNGAVAAADETLAMIAAWRAEQGL
ncbi:MAG: hypothetical protein ABSD27_11965 [Bryobacteraceae bacterium]|jgi:hypothetical protein